GVAPDLDLHAVKPMVDPALDLLAKLIRTVVTEPPRAVDRDRFPEARQSVGEAHPEQLRLEVPQRYVYSRDRHRGDSILAELSGLHLHLREGLLGHEWIGLLDDAGKLGPDD